ncbi:hypothetical protein BGW80DRAFT_1304837 [Lactifluus volemus]|nr:hypothetical protein BGW80DRAFT_1304837 [Lactifluus volemus]
MSSPSVHPPTHHQLPQVYTQNPSICRRFIYSGNCQDACPRLHVPYADMADLLDYLVQRRDCPRELHSVKIRLARPAHRVELSDRICPQYLQSGSCRFGSSCRRSHLRTSYLQFIGTTWQVRPNQTQRITAPKIESDAPPTTPVDTTSSVDAPLPEKLEGPSLDPTPPLDISAEAAVVVQLPKSTTSSGEVVSTESDPSKPSPCPATVPSLEAEANCRTESCDPRESTCDPVPSDEPPGRETQRLKGHRRRTLSEYPLLAQDRQQENGGTTNHSEENSVDASVDAVPAINKSTVSNGYGVLTPAIASSPSKPRRRSIPLNPEICQKHLVGECLETKCSYKHVPPRLGALLGFTVWENKSKMHMADALAPSKGASVPQVQWQRQEATPQSQMECASAATPTTGVESDPAVVIACIGNGPSHPVAQHPSTLTQTNGSLISNTPKDVLVPKSQDVLPPELPPPPPPKSQDVDFSGGFSISKIVTGFESLRFSINGIPVSTKRRDVERLVAPFGKIQDVQFSHESQNSDSATTIAKVQMASYREVVQVFGNRITVQLSLSCHLAKRMIRDTGYAGPKCVSKADGMTERNHWITATMYEGIPVVGAYNVHTMMERPNYQSPDFGIPAVERILQNFGKITHFQPFDSPDVAAAACELHRVKQRSLGMEKIFVKRVLSVQKSVPRAKFNLVEEDLNRLRQKLWNHIPGAHIDLLTHHVSKDPSVRLVAEDSKTLARLRVEISEILDGEILKENGEQVWDDSLRREAGTRFLDQLRERHARVMISVHFFRRCIRLIGTVEQRQAVAAAILDKFSSLRQHKVHTIPLDGPLKAILVSPDLLAAQQRHGEENVRLDLQRKVLCVRGPEELYVEIQQIIQTVKSRHVDSGDEHCPVCLEPPMTPVSLNCGHRWCEACLVAYLNAASDTRSFPIKCLGNQGKCGALVPIMKARMVLPPADFDALALAAFHAYVQSNPDDYHYCPTPDCPQAYPTGPRNSSVSCPSCLARICPSCHVEYHEGVTCADREDGGDRLFQEWMRTHGVKKCPGCHAPIERSEGCNHMTCTRCHTHTCWVCLDTFPEGHGIYDHMREFHGGIGL